MRGWTALLSNALLLVQRGLPVRRSCSAAAQSPIIELIEPYLPGRRAIFLLSTSTPLFPLFLARTLQIGKGYDERMRTAGCGRGMHGCTHKLWEVVVRADGMGVWARLSGCGRRASRVECGKLELMHGKGCAREVQVWKRCLGLSSVGHIAAALTPPHAGKSTSAIYRMDAASDRRDEEIWSDLIRIPRRLPRRTVWAVSDGIDAQEDVEEDTVAPDAGPWPATLHAVFYPHVCCTYRVGYQPPSIPAWPPPRRFPSSMYDLMSSASTCAMTVRTHVESVPASPRGVQHTPSQRTAGVACSSGSTRKSQARQGVELVQWAASEPSSSTKWCPKGWTSDVGWRCMLRTSQTLRCSALWSPLSTYSTSTQTVYALPLWFLDAHAVPFDVRRMALAGEGKGVGKVVGMLRFSLQPETVSEAEAVSAPSEHGYGILRHGHGHRSSAQGVQRARWIRLGLDGEFGVLRYDQAGIHTSSLKVSTSKAETVEKFPDVRRSLRVSDLDELAFF
ncbi:hypothetical protein B0H12DRAFT_1070229 [Mycena haematopus]|nr:hypothetical protein B0H12DRAFT_1070229 [Mycena haematopus]